MARWARSWGLKQVNLFTGADAEHGRAIDLFDTGDQTKLMMFAGHGKPTGLLTEPAIGKSSSPIRTAEHGCLVDAEDIVEGLRGLHIAAWACDAGSYFGARVATLGESAFLGFSGPVSVTINHDESEQLWCGLIGEFFRRIADKGNIEEDDAEWLRGKLLDMRRAINDGRVKTGIHDLMNTSFLFAAAKNVAVHISQR